MKLLLVMSENYGMVLDEGLVSPKYFEHPVDSYLCNLILRLFKRLGSAPTLDVVRERVKKEKPEPIERLGIVRRIKMLDRILVSEGDRRFIVGELRRFAGLQAIKNAISESIPALKEGDVDLVRSKLNKAINVGLEEPLPESMYFDDVIKRVSAEEDRTFVRTLISELDASLRGGGLGRREVGAILAVSNVGKTMCLCHLAKAAMIQNYSVVYFSLDDVIDIIAERLDGSFSGVRLAELKTKRARVIRRVEKFGKLYGDKIILKECVPGTSVTNMDSFLDKVSSNGFRADMVIVDYANLVGPSNGTWYRNRYKELGSIYQDFKSWAKKRNMVVWTAAQASRAAMGKELTTGAEIAESFEGIMLSNVVVSLNRTPEEKSREAMRLFIAKNKSSISEITIKIKTNFTKGSFYRKEQAVEEDEVN